jgi:hypothetical protein
MMRREGEGTVATLEKMKEIVAWVKRNVSSCENLIGE